MGQSISSIKEEAQKQNAENEKLANDALNSLLEVAMAKSDLFYAKVLSSGNGDKLVPIKKIIRQVNFYKAAVSEDSSDFAKALTDTISEFASGSFIAGINSLVTTAIKILFGSYSGNMSQQQSYLIAIGPMGGVVRIDYFLYSYRFTSDTLIKIVKNVLLVNVVVSSVDLTSLDLNTVRVILQGTYTDLTKDQVDKMCQEVIQEIQNSNGKNTAPQRTALLECGRFDHRPTNQHQPQQKSDEVLAQSYQEQNDAMKSLRDYYENYHNYIYGRDAIIYRDIFEAKDKGVIKRVGEARYDETRHFQNRWNGQRLIEYGFQDERDGNGARVDIPEEYDTLWVRLSNDGYINFKCSFMDGKKEEVGVFSTGFRFLNQLAPDGATQDTHWNHHGWVPVPVGRSGSVVLVSKGESELWISGVAFSKNIWKIANNSAYAYTKAFNGGDTFKLSDPWQNDQLGVMESGRVYKLKVPVVPSNNDKLLYFVEHNNNWDGFNHTKITVNGVEIERLRTSYDNPLARHYNSKIYSRYGAARIPASLIKKDDRFVEVAINMSEQNQSFYFREAGTHDYILPTTLNSS